MRFRHFKPIGAGGHEFWLWKARRGVWHGTWALIVGSWDGLWLRVTDEEGRDYSTPTHSYAGLMRKINERVGDWHEVWATFTPERGYLTVDGETISWEWPKRITLAYTPDPILLGPERCYGAFDFDWIILEAI